MVVAPPRDTRTGHPQGSTRPASASSARKYHGLRSGYVHFRITLYGPHRPRSMASATPRWNASVSAAQSSSEQGSPEVHTTQLGGPYLRIGWAPVMTLIAP